MMKNKTYKLNGDIITTGDGYIASMKQNIPIVKTGGAATLAQIEYSTFDIAGNPSAGVMSIGNTANGLVPQDTTAGFPVMNDFGSGNTGYLSRFSFGSSVASRLKVWDRLFHAGNYSPLSLGTTTLSSQPSFVSRLPNSDYKGTFIILEIATTFSATATTVEVTYTNQDGTTGRTTGATASLSGFTARRMVIMPFQSGDCGVQKIESVIVGGTVASAGAFNVVIARLLVDNARVLVAGHSDVLGLDRTGMPIVSEHTAFWLTVTPDSTALGVPDVFLEIANG